MKIKNIEFEINGKSVAVVAQSSDLNPGCFVKVNGADFATVQPDFDRTATWQVAYNVMVLCYGATAVKRTRPWTQDEINERRHLRPNFTNSMCNELLDVLSRFTK